MNELWKKLNLKDQDVVVVVGAPEGFEPALDALAGVRVVRDLVTAEGASFFLAFVTTKKEIESTAKRLAKAAVGDAVVWFAYPKKSSKRYSCEFDRDTGWEPLGRTGFEGVRQVAIDEDWSALRFRRVEFIKTMKRAPKHALSKEGRARAKRGRSERA